MSVEESLFSKIIDENNPLVFTQYGIEREDFVTEDSRKAHEFIRKYAEENGGNAPSYATFVSANPNITYLPGVTDSYEFLVRKIKESAGKRSIAKLFNERVPILFESLDPESLISTLTADMEQIRIRTRTSVPIGTNICEHERFLEEYRARREGRSFRIWRSKFPSVNAAIGGGYYSSNMYTIFARSGRGKSVITMEEALEFAYQGASVLVWALEMGLYEWMARAYSSISARQGLLTAHIDGIDYAAGFETKAFLSGNLPEQYTDGFEQFLRDLPSMLPGKIIVRAVDDPDFRERNLRQLEADIIETKADVVVVDPFYYLEYEANTSRTTGGDAANTSKALRLLAGRTKTTIIAVTQADEDSKEEDDEGRREIRLPKRDAVAKTKALLQDASVTIAIDTLAHEGRGMIGVKKGRNGGEDTRIELVYLPNYGIVREVPMGEALAGQFSATF